MNREEILEKSRQDGEDEGMEQAEYSGKRIGMIAFCGVYLVILMISLISDIETAGPAAMFCAFIAAESYPKYRFTKRKLYLATSLIAALAAILSLVDLIFGVFNS